MTITPLRHYKPDKRDAAVLNHLIACVDALEVISSKELSETDYGGSTVYAALAGVEQIIKEKMAQIKYHSRRAWIAEALGEKRK